MSSSTVTYPCDHKRCYQCKSVKPCCDFSRDRIKRDGLCSYCKPCVKINHIRHQARPEYRERDRIRSAIRRQTPKHKAYAKAYNYRWARLPETKAIRRAALVKRKYGITSDAYDKMAEEQAGVCAICGNPPRFKKILAVDHDHRSGRVRGLLCIPCNVGIGNLGDDVKVLESAIAYLSKFQEQFSEVQL